MALRDTDTLTVETGADLTPSLPDPTAVPGRTHDLTNTGAASAVWGSTGATPFQVDGVAVATLSVARGATARVQSDGTRWVLIRPVGSRPSFAGTAVTDGSGNAVFTFPAGLFPAAPVVVQGLQVAAANDVIESRVTALTATSCTVNVRRSPVVTVLAVSVLGAPAALSGATVHLLATPAGSAT